MEEEIDLSKMITLNQACMIALESKGIEFDEDYEKIVKRCVLE